MSSNTQTNKATQNRNPPAFQEYAAAMMATVQYRLLSLAERGLLYTLRLECWVNARVPHDPKELAKYLGVNEMELCAAMPRVMFFFGKEEESIYCPELENYREYLSQVRAKQSTGGKKGAVKANEQRQKLEEAAAVNSSRVPQGLTTGSLDKSSPNKLSSNSVINKEVSNEHEEWIKDFDSTKPRS